MTDRQAPLSEVDSKIAELIRREVARQEHGLELIASENFVSVAVLEAMGTALTNKYAEGLPGKRSYGGAQVPAQVERLETARAKPRIIIGGGSAYARIVDFPALRSIADEVDAVLVVDMAHFAGLVAGGVYPSPVPHAQIVTTTTHKTLRGPRGGMILCNTELAK